MTASKPAVITVQTNRIRQAAGVDLERIELLVVPKSAEC